MTSFVYVSHYSPLFSLIAGVVTFAACTGLGRSILRLAKAGVPDPFRQVVAIILGVSVASLLVQVVAMLHLASKPPLVGLWLILICFSPLAFASAGSWSVSQWSRGKMIALGIVVVAAGLNLSAALAPSSKIDELYYHMLFPSRILADHGLNLYRMPWESAIGTQMTYQILGSPLHALGAPDAPNVLSWCLSITLVWFGWSLLARRGSSRDMGYCFLATMLVGMYPAVWYVTAGAHAFGDLATAAALVLLTSYMELSAEFESTTFVACLSILCCAAAGSKITLLPIAFILVFLGAIVAWPRTVGNKIPMLASLILPWLIFFTPMGIWTFLHSGSPFGPILAGQFGVSAYRIGEGSQIITDTQAANQGQLLGVLAHSAINCSPLIWFGVAGACLSRRVPRRTRALVTILFLGQLIFTWSVLPHDLRFLGGLQYGMLILFALFASDDISSDTTTAMPLAFTLAILAVTIPWLAIQGWYTRPFFRVATGTTTALDFCHEFVAFFDDYRQLDGILPRDAVLYVPDFRAPAVYAPRPMVFDSRDIPHNQAIFLFSSEPAQTSNIPPGFTTDETVYFNPTARRETFRTPGRTARMGPLYVTALRANPT